MKKEIFMVKKILASMILFSGLTLTANAFNCKNYLSLKASMSIYDEIEDIYKHRIIEECPSDEIKSLEENAKRKQDKFISEDLKVLYRIKKDRETYPNLKTKELVKKVGKLKLPHQKKAVKLVGQYTKKELRRLASSVYGCFLSMPRRGYLHAIDNYHAILKKHYIVEHTGVSADNMPVTNGVLREGIDRIHEITDKNNDANQAIGIAGAVVGAAASFI